MQQWAMNTHFEKKTKRNKRKIKELSKNEYNKDLNDMYIEIQELNRE